MNLLEELQRRNVFRIGVGYLAISWFVVELIATIAPEFGLENLTRISIILLSIGFVPVLVIAWIFQITPDGIKLDAEADSSPSVTKRTGQLLDRVIIGFMGLAIIVLLADRFFLEAIDSGGDIAVVQEHQEKIKKGPISHLNSPPKTRAEVEAMYSIAVLPFANMSSNDSTGFFATGLSEEILDNLAQAKWLRVASRSASFQFTGLGVSPSKVGTELNVSYLLEGSVRQADDKLRITAQLIRTEDGFNIWSKSYEGMLKGFELQTAVAANIARFTETMLENDVFKNHEWKLKSWTADIDPIAIKHYMTAGDINRQENGDSETALQFLRNAVEVDPKFYAAYIELTNGNILNHRFGKLPLQEARPAAHAAIDSALEIVPDFADAIHLLALVHLFLDLNYASADAVMRRELVLDPEYGWSHIRLANIAVREGRTGDALKRIASTSERIRGSTRVSFLRNVSGDYEGALKASVKRTKLFLEGQDRADHLRSHATSLVMLGRTEEAKPLIEEGWQLDGVTNPEPYIALFAYVGDSEKSKSILSDSRFDLANHYHLAEGYLALGDADKAFRSILAGIEDHDQHLIESLVVAKWWDPIRDDPRFDEMLELLESKVTHTEQYLREHNIPRKDE